MLVGEEMLNTFLQSYKIGGDSLVLQEAGIFLLILKYTLNYRK